MSNTDRKQQMVERIVEDEGLRGDLEDSAATALIDWASERAGAIAADSSRSDADVEAAISAIRMAARQAANSGETEPDRVVAQAEAALAPQTPASQAPQAASEPAHAGGAPTAAPSAPQQSTPDTTRAGGVEAPTLPAVAAGKPKATTSKPRKTRRRRSRKKSK